MTAVRVITDHSELEGIGQLTHDQLDSHVNTTPFVIISGTVGTTPPTARKLQLGPGIIATDDGPGGNLTLSIDPAFINNTTHVFNEIPSGSIDGVNQNFFLASAPVPPASLQLFFNGVMLDQGAMHDYVLSGSSITMMFAPKLLNGHGKLRAWYQK